MSQFYKLSNILNKSKLSQKPIQAAWICHIAQEKIDQFFPERDIFVSSYRNKTINIKVPNSALASEIRIKSEELKNKINKNLKKDLVERIRTKIV